MIDEVDDKYFVLDSICQFLWEIPPSESIEIMGGSSRGTNPKLIILLVPFFSCLW